MRGSISAVVMAGLIAACSARTRPDAPAAPTSATRMPDLLPLPVSIDASRSGPFVVTPATVVTVPAGDERMLQLGQLVSQMIGLSTGPARLQVITTSAAGNAIQLQLGEVSLPGDEAYDLSVTSDAITIRGRTPAGVFFGTQTLRQLLPAALEHEAVRPDKDRPVQAPALRVSDSPRFSWRGAMLDVARHFLSVDDVKRYIDLMALHKLNRLHLHLADDQGWRVEIASWPRLTEHGGSTEVGGGAGGFYSAQQYAEIVAYARTREVVVVPEIDMPGHTNAALASYADLNCSGVAPPLHTGIEVGFSALCVEKEVTYKFIDDVVREIAALTPGPYFHIGGDEVKTLSDAQYRMFIERVQGIVRSHGKQMIGWDEIAPVALDRSSIVQHWRPKTSPREAQARGAKVILSPADRTYLDMKYDRSTPIGLTWAAVIEVRDAYEWDPGTLLADVPEGSILGVEAPLWTETVANIRDAEFLAYPRLAAVAEVGWSRSDRRSWEDFRTRLGAQGPRWTALGINFYRSPQIPWKSAGG